MNKYFLSFIIIFNISTQSYANIPSEDETFEDEHPKVVEKFRCENLTKIRNTANMIIVVQTSGLSIGWSIKPKPYPRSYLIPLAIISTPVLIFNMYVEHKCKV